MGWKRYHAPPNSMRTSCFGVRTEVVWGEVILKRARGRQTTVMTIVNNANVTYRNRLEPKNCVQAHLSLMYQIAMCITMHKNMLFTQQNAFIVVHFWGEGSARASECKVHNYLHIYIHVCIEHLHILFDGHVPLHVPIVYAWRKLKCKRNWNVRAAKTFGTFCKSKMAQNSSKRLSYTSCT